MSFETAHYTSVGFFSAAPPVRIEKHQHLHLKIGELVVLVNEATARELRDALIDLDLGEDPS